MVLSYTALGVAVQHPGNGVRLVFKQQSVLPVNNPAKCPVRNTPNK
jgi:hypothetical protein